MATVTFENGKSVVFQGTPTPADINEVAAKMNIQPASSGFPSLSDIGTGLGKIANNIEQPFISVAAAPVQLLAKAMGQKDPYANNAFPGPNGQGVPVAPATPAGFLQKAGQAGQIATLVASGGASTVPQMALLGGASGLSQSVANGNTDPGQLAKDTIYGTIFGTALGFGGKFLSYMGKTEAARTGVEGAVADAIDHTDPELLSQYIDASANHGDTMASLGQPNAVGLAEDEFDKRAALLTDKVIPAAGKALGAARDAAGDAPIVLNVEGSPVTGSDAVHTMTDNINEVMQNLTRHQFSAYATGENSALSISNYAEGASTAGTGVEGDIVPLPGRNVDLSSTEQKQLQYLSDQLAKLKDTPTLQTAMDVKTNLSTEVGKWSDPQFGSANSPVQGVMKYAYGQVAQSISDVSPEIAKVTDDYSALMNLRDQLSAQAGKDGQNSALMMRRVLSGDKSNSVVPILNQLDAATAPFREGDATSLVQHSILSSWATNLFGDESTKGLLSQAISQGNKLSSEGSSIFGYPKQFMNYLVR